MLETYVYYCLDGQACFFTPKQADLETKVRTPWVPKLRSISTSILH